MATDPEVEDLIRRQSACIKTQLDRIAELEVENERLRGAIAGSHDALAVLQEIYSDRRNPLSAVMRAAGAAINFERSKPVTTITAEISLYDALEARRQQNRKKLADNPSPMIDVTPDKASIDPTRSRECR